MNKEKMEQCAAAFGYSHPRLIGKGFVSVVDVTNSGFAFVFQATDIDSGEIVVIKLIPDIEDKSKVESEIKVLRECHSSFIVKHIKTIWMDKNLLVGILMSIHGRRL